MDLDTWAERLRNENTRKMYVYALRQFLAFFNVDAGQTLEWGAEEAEEHLLQWKDSLMQRGLSGQSIRIFWAAVRRWFNDNRIRVTAKCEDMGSEKTYLDYIPSHADVQKLIDECPLKLRLAVSLIAFAGMRPVDVVSLQYKNVRASYEAKDEITTIVIQQKKTHSWYFTFLSPQGTRYLRAVLENRQMQDDDYILLRHGRPLRSVQLRLALLWVIRRRFGKHPTGEPFRLFRPYGLRKYFRRVVSRLGEDTAEFLMGHSAGLSSLTATYSGLRDMDAEAISALKEQYISLLSELETEVSDVSVQDKLHEIEQMKRQLDQFTSYLADYKRKQDRRGVGQRK